jgi:hypothetical protein
MSWAGKLACVDCYSGTAAIEGYFRFWLPQKIIVDYFYKRYCAALITAPIYCPTEYSSMNRGARRTKKSVKFGHSANLVHIAYWRGVLQFANILAQRTFQLFRLSGRSNYQGVPVFPSFWLFSGRSSPDKLKNVRNVSAMYVHSPRIPY